MRIALLILALLALLIFPGCWVFSFSPVFEEKDLAFDASLAGTWWQPRPGCTLVITTDVKDRSYLLDYSSPKTQSDGECLFDSGEQFKFSGHLFELKDRLFLDIVPAEEKTCFPCVPLHSTYQVGLDKASLALTPLNDKWLETEISRKTVSVETAKTPEYDLILTAGTADLKELYTKYMNDKEAFRPMPELTFERKATADSPKLVMPPKKNGSAQKP